MLVMKFGGTSVADAAAIRRLLSIVGRQRDLSVARRAAEREGSVGSRAPETGPLVVVSALGGVTDRLLDIANLAQKGLVPDATAILETLRTRHHDVATVVQDPERRAGVHAAIDREFDLVRGLIGAWGVLREVTPRSSDALVAVGELLSSRIVAAALMDAGLPGVWIDARRALVTNEDYGAAAPLMEETSAAVRREIAPHLVDEVPVVGGFVGATVEGITTTLGRGGSDYSASLFGACVMAEEIQIWTDVDGMLTADPRVVDAPQLVPHLSFAEASELAYFGAKVLHPSTIQPAVELDIPVRILNARRPENPGTLITASPPPRSSPLTALACTRDVTVIDITSSRMLMAHGFLRRLFEVFERYRTAVDVVTTSEVSVSVTINDRRHLEPLLAALSAFAEVSCEHDMALVCAVSEHFQSDPTLFGRVLGALEGVSLRMVSQAASRRNVTFVIRQADLADTMNRLHGRFFAAAAPEGAARTIAPAAN